ncbi:MAG: DUF3846 domain-containing protein [Clostridiaceae bacterium]
MKVIYKEPYKDIHEKEIEVDSNNYSDAIKEFIGEGYEHLWLPHNIMLLHNADAKSLNLEPNIPVAHNLVLGNVIFIGSDSDENFASLTEIQIAYIRKKYFISYSNRSNRPWRK